MHASPSFDDIVAASERLRGHAVLTPLLELYDVNETLGGRLLLKPEMLQRTGSFKFRGAFNRLNLFTDEQRAAGVVAYSSGNHAQGVAAAAKILGIPAVIIMPSDAPGIKIENTRAFGAEVVLYDRWTEDRQAIGELMARERGLTLVRPFDDPGVIAGQGTCGLELARQSRGLGAELDAVLVPASGGGLIAGLALAFEQECPTAKLYSVEPEGFDDLKRSLEARQRVANEGAAESFCDSLLSKSPGEITFPIHQRLVTGGLSVSDAEVATAMRFAFQKFKLVVEPGGAVALAAILSGKFDIVGKTVAIVCSGGNVDPATFCGAMTA